MKTVVVFFLVTFVFSFNSLSQTKIEIKGLTKSALISQQGDEKHIYTCDTCYILLEDCVYENCGYILEELYSQEIEELKSEVPEDWQLYFLFDKEKKVGMMMIIPKNKICFTSAGYDKFELSLFYLPMYR